ncbi:hypothetical protein EMMF5_006315 [Cystobasidiomycetes sp. EMM_F5]
MADKLPKILLLGSTGAAGKAIASALIENTQSFETIAFFTSPESANTKKDIFDGYRDKGIKVIASDLEDDNYISGLFKEYDVIVSALGRNALQLQSRLVDLIAALPPLSSGRPRRLYPSEYGTDIRYDPKTSPHERPHQLKLKTRAHIEEVARAGKIEFTYIVTGPFLDTFFKARAGGLAGYDASKNTFGIVGAIDVAHQHIISGTTYADTGRFLVSSLLTPEASRNATLRVASINAKPAEQLTAFEEILGKKLDVSYTPLEEFRQLEQQAWAKSQPDATVYTLTRIWYEGGSDFTRKPVAVYLRDGQEVEDENLSQQLFKDVPKNSLVDVIKSVL